MYIPRDPSKKSYWEGEWLFPPTGTKIAIGLPGTVQGPVDAGRRFYLALPARFEEIVRRAQPGLDRVFVQWIGRPPNSDVWHDVKLAGFGVEDAALVPTRWDIAFETLVEKWLGITIPFIADEPQEPIVDTLLEELHISDDFDVLVGPAQNAPGRCRELCHM
jgi:hypothetical protein